MFDVLVMQQKRPRPIATRQFRPKPTPEELKLRDERRRAATKKRTALYRQRLYDLRAPELRHMAEALLAAFVSTRIVDDPTHQLTKEFLTRITASGFDPIETLKRAKKLRRKFRSLNGNA
jgi:hypothetical protein